MLIHFGFEILLEPLLPLRMKISVISKRFAKDVKTYSSRDILKIKFKSAFFEPVSSIKQDIKFSLVFLALPGYLGSWQRAPRSLTPSDTALAGLAVLGDGTLAISAPVA